MWRPDIESRWRLLDNTSSLARRRKSNPCSREDQACRHKPHARGAQYGPHDRAFHAIHRPCFTRARHLQHRFARSTHANAPSMHMGHKDSPGPCASARGMACGNSCMVRVRFTIWFKHFWTSLDSVFDIIWISKILSKSSSTQRPRYVLYTISRSLKRRQRPGRHGGNCIESSRVRWKPIETKGSSWELKIFVKDPGLLVERLLYGMESTSSLISDFFLSAQLNCVVCLLSFFFLSQYQLHRRRCNLGQGFVFRNLRDPRTSDIKARGITTNNWDQWLDVNLDTHKFQDLLRCTLARAWLLEPWWSACF